MMINPNAFGLKSPFFGQTQRGERRETNSFDTVDLMTFSFYFSLSLALNVFIVTPFNSEVGFCLVITQKTSSIFIPKEKVKRGKRGLITTTFWLHSFPLNRTTFLSFSLPTFDLLHFLEKIYNTLFSLDKILHKT